ncbi:hypothetical protein MKX03_036769, partial [Papaver bracteatum]
MESNQGPRSSYFDLLNCAYTGDLDRFKRDRNIWTLLLSKGIQINVVIKSGTTPSYVALLSQIDIVKVFFDHHAD